jgi:hypothetical protein
MVSTPVMDSEKKVIDDSNSDDAVLAQLGYTQGNFNYHLFERPI